MRGPVTLPTTPSAGEFRSDVELVEIYRGGPKCALHVLVYESPHGTARAVHNGRGWVFQSGVGPWERHPSTRGHRRLAAHFHLELAPQKEPS